MSGEKPDIDKLAKESEEKFSLEFCDTTKDTKVVFFYNSKIVKGKDGIDTIVFKDDSFIITKMLKEEIWDKIYNKAAEARMGPFIVLVPQTRIGTKKNLARYNTYPLKFYDHKVYIVKGLDDIEVLDID